MRIMLFSGAMKNGRAAHRDAGIFTLGLIFYNPAFPVAIGGLNTCLDAVDESQGKVETPPDPVRPKGTGNHTPPIGGTKDEPKVPSKVNDTRAPRSDGVCHPKSSGSTPPPILLKSNGGNGPSFRSHGRH